MNNQTAKRKICAVILWIMLLFWMAFIFSMSSQEASKSSKSSGEVIETILKIVKPDYESLTATEKYDLIDSLQFIVRKIAHFTGYTIIGILSYWALFSTFSLKGDNNRTYKIIIFALLIGLLYSVSDEIHQFFVPGRSCELRDVIIDFSGVTLGVGLSFAVLVIVRKIRSKNEKAHIL